MMGYGLCILDSTGMELSGLVGCMDPGTIVCNRSSIMDLTWILDAWILEPVFTKNPHSHLDLTWV